MENLLKETLIHSIKQLEDIVRCAVCLDVLKQDMVQCVNGHLVCSECKTDLDQCPTCMGAFSPDKPSKLFTQFVEALPHRCEHNCGEYLNIDDDHEKYCGYKETLCKIRNCTWTGPGKDIFNHVKEKHSDYSFFFKESISASFLMTESTTKLLMIAPIMAYQTFLWKKTSLDSTTKKFFKTFYCVPNGKPAKDWSAELYIKSGKTTSDSYFSCKVKLNMDPDVDDEENIIYIPWKSVPDFINENNHISYVLNFTKK